MSDSNNFLKNQILIILLILRFSWHIGPGSDKKNSLPNPDKP